MVLILAQGCGSGALPKPHPLAAQHDYPLLTSAVLVDAIHRVHGAENYRIRVDSIDDKEARVRLNGDAFTLDMVWHYDRWEWWYARTPDGRVWGSSAAVVRWFSRGKPPLTEPDWHRKG